MRVTQKSNAATVAALNKYRALQLGNEFYKALHYAQVPIKLAAEKRSNGTLPTKTLSKPPPGSNHPYGHGPSNWRGPRGPQPYGGAQIWNKQKGNVKAAWMTSIGFRADRAHVRLFNPNQIAWWLNYGTKKMRGRDVLAGVHRDEDLRFSAMMLRAFRKAYGIP